MPPQTDSKLTPSLYQYYLTYKRATTIVERWLADNSCINSDPESRLTIVEMKQAASIINDKRIKIPSDIDSALERAIIYRSEVTSHFKDLFATETIEAKNLSHERFTGE